MEGALYRRKDFLEKEEAGQPEIFTLTNPFSCTFVKNSIAKSHPNRVFYYRRGNAEDVDRMIQETSVQIKNDPNHAKVRYTWKLLTSYYFVLR